MKSYVKLVNFEFNRFFKIYVVLVGITILCQITGVIFEGLRFVKEAQETMQHEMITMEQYAMEFGAISMYDFIETIWFIGPVAICIVTLLIYMLFIWYRDWYGKHTFIYRLLMLPVERLNIYFAKVTAIFLFVLGLVSLQLILLIIENNILTRLVPEALLMEMSITSLLTFDILIILYPPTFSEFLLYYGAGFLFILVVFTMILLERSFRIKGILLAACYGGVIFALLLAPILINESLNDYFYPIEILAIEGILALMIGTVSIMLSRFLLNKKITV